MNSSVMFLRALILLVNKITTQLSFLSTTLHYNMTPESAN